LTEDPSRAIINCPVAPPPPKKTEQDKTKIKKVDEK